MKTYSNQKEAISQTGLNYLNEEENAHVESAIQEWLNAGGKIEHLDEGFFGKLLGGAAGFVVGPTIGKIVARALGITTGPLYDVLTSRLVSTALGASIAGSQSRK